jgi:hypothetical protein
MACIINASTTSGLVSSADLSGNLQLQWNGQAAPAFSAYQSSAQTLSTSTATKLTFTTEEFDTNNNFASSTFTPTVAGYYQVSGGIQVSTTRCDVQVLIYKNGAVWKQGGYGSSQAANTVSGLVYCNGSTDYIDLYGIVSVGQALNANASQTYFQACLVRGA